MCPEQMGNHQSGARVRRGHRIREPTIRRGHQMSSPLHVQRGRGEGSVSKKAVFSGQIGGNGVRVVCEVARAGQLGNALLELERLSQCKASAICNPHFFTGFTPQRPQHPSLSAQSISTSSQPYVKRSSPAALIR